MSLVVVLTREDGEQMEPPMVPVGPVAGAEPTLVLGG